MEYEVVEHQPKQERLRTRWTASLDKIFADLVVEQIHLGNRKNNVFDKKTWNHIRDEFNRQTDLSFNNNQLRKHLDVLRTRYYNLKSSFDQNDFALDDSCYTAIDLWDMGVQLKPDSTKIKDCPILEQLCTIFADLGADGKYAQSSHYAELDKSNPSGLVTCLENENLAFKPPTLTTPTQGNTTAVNNLSKKNAERKRKRAADEGANLGDNNKNNMLHNAMAEGMLEMVSALKLHMAVAPHRDERFSISACIKCLDEIEGVDDWLYYAALDLFEDPNLREMFISLKGNNVKWTWLQGKCGNFI
ncbi:hypothetical protein DCAR_0520068 [Daucus carota subsp. sativus]|uniref:Myb/SANT-like domain-containing protein n=1 Tax=Daucus carota subsp. sativus TaxID=79200 RepID=A0A162A0G4_DAUCS|nr:PREDICTED: L10-interacting MYB domain-containing protein-like [Daucus carota subsp. sativus]WOH00694.1 hypothetical protein DCAR_0520068 [Daucus carota subsp. sativus]